MPAMNDNEPLVLAEKKRSQLKCMPFKKMSHVKCFKCCRVLLLISTHLIALQSKRQNASKSLLTVRFPHVYVLPIHKGPVGLLNDEDIGLVEISLRHTHTHHTRVIMTVICNKSEIVPVL